MPEPIIARITKVSKHPKADRLKVCQVDAGDGGGMLQVWNACLCRVDRATSRVVQCKCNPEKWATEDTAMLRPAGCDQCRRCQGPDGRCGGESCRALRWMIFDK
jgi:Putative tRNA binding domain